MDNLCDSVQKQIIKLHLAKQPIDEDQDIQSHLSGCPACQVFLQRLEYDNQGLLDRAGSLDDYVDQVQTRFSQANGQTETTPGARGGIKWGYIAVISLLIAGLAYVVDRSSRQRRPIPEANSIGSAEANTATPPAGNNRLSVRASLLTQAAGLYQDNNIPGLIDLLAVRDNAVQQKVLAYLVRLGDPSVIPVLQEMASALYPENAVNPFNTAIAQLQPAAKPGAASRAVPIPAADDPNMKPALETSTSPVRPPQDPAPVAETAADNNALTPGGHALPRSISGQFLIPGYNRPVAWDQWTHMDIIVPQASVPWQDLPKPPDYDTMDLVSVQDWVYGPNTSEPRAPHAVSVDASGYFFSEDLAPGRYVLVGVVTPEPPEPSDASSRPIAHLWYEFSVTPGPDTALDLGSIPLTPSHLQPGDTARDFDLCCLGPGRVRLSDLHGKVVLLSFYRTQDIEDLPDDLLNLVTLYNQYKDHSGFAMIGMVSGYEHPLVIKKLLDTSGLDWTHVYLGPSIHNRQILTYDVPQDQLWNILIGPDQEILTIGLDADTLASVIGEALLTVR